MIERGVRFVNIYHEGWDAHSDVVGNHKDNCGETDRASAALVIDLKRRGLLDDTLVIWGGEFGRTPMVETNPALGRSLGRDHHPQAFTMWLAGGGVKPGLTYGDNRRPRLPRRPREPVHVHDLQATILHLLGFDHERLIYRFQGRDYPPDRRPRKSRQRTAGVTRAFRQVIAWRCRASARPGST